MVRPLGGVISPCQTVSMLPTLMAPTSTRAMGPASVSNTVTTRSLRANSPGTRAVVTGLTLNRRPGTWMVSCRVPVRGMWMRW